MKPPTLAECKRWREMAQELQELRPDYFFPHDPTRDAPLDSSVTDGQRMLDVLSTVPRLAEAYEQAVGALQCAVETIRALHGPVAWEIYRDQSPEMKRIRAAIPEDTE